MKRDKTKIKKGIHQLSKDMDSITKKRGELIFELSTDLCKAYIEDSSKVIIKLENTIYEQFYTAFEEAYSITSSSLKNIYNKVLPYDIKKIKDLTYSEDGKTVDDRIREYFDDAKSKIDKNTEQIVKQRLRYNLYRILDTEIKNISETVKRNKKPIPEDGLYVIQVIEGCGNDCGHDCIEYNGIYPEDEDIEWPPYHPSCTGIGYYDFTDDPDEIEEAGIEEGDSDESR